MSRLRTAIFSAHSHQDRSFLDDRELALLSGDLHGSPHDHRWIVAACAKPDALPEGALDALDAVDVLFFERIWSDRLLAPLRAALPDAAFVHIEGEHALPDPPADFVIAGNARRAVPALLAHIEGDAPLPSGVRRRTERGWSPGLGPLGEETTRFAPDLHPTVIPAGALPSDRSFSLLGNPGCPYQADARENPAYEGVSLPEGLGRGCAFCVTGNHYDPRPHATTAADLIEQIRFVRRGDPDRRRLVLKDQNPFAYLPRVMRGVRDDALGGFSLLLETRADWFLSAGARLEETLHLAADADVTLAPFLVGIENFSPRELERMNKGTDVETLERFLREVGRWERDFPAFDLSEASFGFVLFTPWTTLEDLRVNLDAVRRTRLHERRGHFLLSRVRLYPDTAMHYLAKRDGLLREDAPAPWEDASARYGYFAAPAWRFRDPRVARYAALAADALEALGGRDELRVWEVLQTRFEAGESPSLEEVVAAARSAPTRRARTAAGGRVMQAGLGGRCALRCAPCDCRRIRATDPDSLPSEGVRTLVLRGGARSAADLRPLVERARATGVESVWLRTHGLHARSATAAGQLAHLVDGVIVPVFSQRPEVHDAITGVAGSFAGAQEAMRALAAAGVALELETPLLAPALQTPAELVELAHALGARAVRFTLPRHEVPSKLAPPPWSVGAAPLAAAIARAGELGIETPLDPPAAIPLCALREHPAAGAAHRVSPPRKGGVRADGSTLAPVCDGCGLRDRCPGVARSYLDAHGARDLEALDTLPLVSDDAWTDDRRAAAQSTKLLVVRPTVHCNQDCAFCSANETSKNVLEDSGAMMRAIARAADRGLERVSFSGGEPTLHRDLPAFVEVARKCGVPKVELVTNGVLLAKRAKVQRLVDAGLTHAFVSLHAHDESLSYEQTGKAGDFDRTLQAVEHLLDLGVVTVLNHVLNARNHRFVREFVRLVRARFGGRVMTSIAFVTPQYKALEHPELVPSIREVWPTLRSALHEALVLEQPVVIGSRQGIPPCLLGEFEAWSDLAHVTSSARAEDSPQKVRAEGCDRCRYANFCTGLWRPYADRFGTGELAPIGDDPWSDDDLDRFRAWPRPAPHGVFKSFADVPAELRHPEQEAEGRRLAEEQEARPARTRLPVLRTRASRVVLVGTGSRARELIHLLAELPDVMLAAVASPHAPEASLPDLQGAPRYRDVRTMIEETRPDGVTVACATIAHAEAAQVAIEEGLPVLVEKPLTDDPASAATLIEQANAAGVPLMPAHNLAFLPLLDEAFTPLPSALRLVREVGRGQPDAPQRWSRPALRETLLHLVSVALRGAGGRPLELVRAAGRGDGRPEHLDATFASEGLEVEVRWSADAPTDRFVVAARHGTDERTVTREGARTTLRNPGGERDGSGSDTTSMLRRFRALLRDEDAGWRPPAEDGAEAMRLTDAWLDAMEVPWQRANEPRRARTKKRRPTPIDALTEVLREARIGLRPVEGQLRRGNAELALRRRPSAPPRALPWEEEAFRAGLKPVLYLVLHPDEAPPVRERLSDVALAEFRFRETVAPGDVRTRGVGDERIALFASQERSLAEEAAAMQSEDPTRHAAALGALLGYPDCCVRAFLAQSTRSDNSLNRHLAASRTTAERWPWELADLHDKPIPFHPCRYDCPEGLRFGRALYGTFEVRRRDALRDRLARPVLYFGHGASLHFDADGAHRRGGVTVVEGIRGIEAVGDAAMALGRWLVGADALQRTTDELLARREGRTLARWAITDPDRVTLAPFQPS